MANIEENLTALVLGAEADASLWHTIIHGDSVTTVATENGNIPTVAKQLKDVRDELINGAEDYLGNCRNLKSEAEQIQAQTRVIKSDTNRIKEQTSVLKSDVETLKSQTENLKRATELAVSFALGPNLFDTKWEDYQLNDISWLRSDMFSWQSGTLYSEAYNHLLVDIEGKSIQIEEGISYYQADDGHKIVLPDQEAAIVELYKRTGYAWYYILDIENQRFKLPQERNTKSSTMYLYFFMGNRSREAIEQTAGLNVELFNGKADKDMFQFVDTLPVNRIPGVFYFVRET